MQNLSKATLVYVGTRGPKSKGIYFYRLQTDNLEVSQNITLVPLGLAAETPNPNFIELDVKRRLLFAATRVDHFAGKSTGAPGPRHVAFLPDARFAYAVNELDSTVTSYAYDAKAGALKPIETQSTVPGYYDGRTNTPAEVAAHPSGRWIYVSNRGMSSIILFGVDPDKCTLTYIEEQGTGGKTPRHFGIRPSAKHMVICNQDSDTLLAARIDSVNGRLKPSGVFAEAPTPMCAKFLPPASGGLDYFFRAAVFSSSSRLFPTYSRARFGLSTYRCDSFFAGHRFRPLRLLGSAARQLGASAFSHVQSEESRQVFATEDLRGSRRPFRLRNALPSARDEFLLVQVMQPEEKVGLLIQPRPDAVEHRRNMLTHVGPIRTTA